MIQKVEILKFLSQAINSLSEIDDIVNGRKYVDNDEEKIKEFQDIAAEAIGVVNPILDKYARREKNWGSPSKKVDIFREALTIDSHFGCAILKDALAELKMVQSQIKYDKIEDETNKPKTKEFNNKVFLVHGQNNEIKNTVALLLTRLGLEPIILHEQDNNGNTIIEKFIEYSNVDFAISLLTPDDICTINGKKYKRARQNVIFEFGFFMGKLGRKNVVALFEQSKSFEIPSDINGLVYIPYNVNEDTWKLKLAKELKRIFKIDLNKLK
jgi:predicted nucleotide-binding protein